LGAPRTVYVYRFIAPTTYEERMEEIRKVKAEDWAEMQGTQHESENENAEIVEIRDEPNEEQVKAVLASQ
jgi:SNF2 family DNA or RNA helicase